MVNPRVIRFRVREGKTRDQIAFYAFELLLVEVQMQLATYIRAVHA